MGFLAAAIPLAASFLGAMSKEEQKPPQPALPPPPSLGEIFAMNDANFARQNMAQPANPFSQFPPTGGGKGQYG